MIKGRRARSDCGSPHGDRPYRWGASVTGASQSALRAYSMWCPDDRSGTDRSSSELWLERSLRPDPGSGCTRRATSITNPRAPPKTPLDRFENHKGLDKTPHRSSHSRVSTDDRDKISGERLHPTVANWRSRPDPAARLSGKLSFELRREAVVQRLSSPARYSGRSQPWRVG